MEPAVVAALVTSIVSLVVGLLNFYNSRSQMRHQQKQLEIQQGQFERQLRAEIPELVAVDNPEVRAIATIKSLLSDTRYQERSLATIRRHVPGRADDDLRELLMATGAIQTRQNPEHWRLGSRTFDPDSPRR
jgi:hypothetical protein